MHFTTIHYFFEKLSSVYAVLIFKKVLNHLFLRGLILCGYQKWNLKSDLAYIRAYAADRFSKIKS